MTREEYILHQRDALMKRVLDMEADIVMLQVALNEAQARIAELEVEVNRVNDPAINVVEFVSAEFDDEAGPQPASE